MIPLVLVLLLLPLTGYLCLPLLILLCGPSSPASPLPVTFTLTSSGHLQAHLSLDLIRYLLPTLVQLFSLLILVALTIYLTNDLLNSRVASGRWITRGWLNCHRMTTADWQRQVVLITGGAGGLGRELGRLAQAKGACVVTLDVTELPEEEKEDTGSAVRGQGTAWFHYQCDVTNVQQVQDTARQIRLHLDLRKRAAGESGATWPTLPTILINNAGVHSSNLSSSHILTLPSEQVSKVLQVNLLSHFHILHIFLPSILRRGTGGHVVSIASSMGHVGCASMADYVSSKFAVIGLHEVLCRELRAWRKGQCDDRMKVVVEDAHEDVQEECERQRQQMDEEKIHRIFGCLSSSSTSTSSSSSSRVQTTLVIPSHIATPMFPYWRYPWPFHYLTPTLTPTCVAERILEEIAERRSTWVYLPKMTWPTAWMTVISDWARECMFWMSGSDWAVSRMRVLAQQQQQEDMQQQQSTRDRAAEVATSSLHHGRSSSVQTRAQRSSAAL